MMNWDSWDSSTDNEQPRASLLKPMRSVFTFMLILFQKTFQAARSIDRVGNVTGVKGLKT